MKIKDILKEMYLLSSRSLFMGGVTDLSYSPSLVFDNGLAFSETAFKKGLSLSKQQRAEALLGRLYAMLRDTGDSSLDILEAWSDISQYNPKSSLILNKAFGFMLSADEIMPEIARHGRSLELAVSDLGSISGPDVGTARGASSPILTKRYRMGASAYGSIYSADKIKFSKGKVNCGVEVFSKRVRRQGIAYSDGENKVTPEHMLFTLSNFLEVGTRPGYPSVSYQNARYTAYNGDGTKVRWGEEVKKWNDLGVLNEVATHLSRVVIFLAAEDTRNHVRKRRGHLRRTNAVTDISHYANTLSTVASPSEEILKDTEGFDCQKLDLITAILVANMV